MILLLILFFSSFNLRDTFNTSDGMFQQQLISVHRVHWCSFHLRPPIDEEQRFGDLQFSNASNQRRVN